MSKRRDRTIRAVIRNGRYLGRDTLERVRLEMLQSPDLRRNDWSGR